MRPGPTLRAGAGLGASVVVVFLLTPRSVPRLDLLDPAARSAQITQFGLRTVAVLLAGYLALVFLGLLLSAGRLLPASVRALVTRWTAQGLAGSLRRLVGVSALTLGVLSLQPVATHATEAAPVLAPEDIDRPAPRLDPEPAPSAAPPTTAAPRLEPAAEDPAPAEPPAPPARTAPGPRPPDPGPDADRKATTVTTRPGDSFWSVAERLTSSRLGRPADDVEVVEPWLALIEANRDRLTDPDDPDLLFPGQVLRLPSRHS